LRRHWAIATAITLPTIATICAAVMSGILPVNIEIPPLLPLSVSALREQAVPA
jgi:hypothetical protein